MNAIAKYVALNRKSTLEELDKLVDEKIRFYCAIDKKLMGLRCTECGELYDHHIGFDSGCPHPARYEPGMPLRLRDKFFTLAPHRCEALLADSEDTYGNFCGKVCEPGKTLCPEHHE